MCNDTTLHLCPAASHRLHIISGPQTNSTSITIIIIMVTHFPQRLFFPNHTWSIQSAKLVVPIVPLASIKQLGIMTKWHSTKLANIGQQRKQIDDNHLMLNINIQFDSNNVCMLLFSFLSKFEQTNEGMLMCTLVSWLDKDRKSYPTCLSPACILGLVDCCWYISIYSCVLLLAFIFFIAFAIVMVVVIIVIAMFAVIPI